MIDYLILAPLDLEIAALLKEFNAELCPRQTLPDGASYFALTQPTNTGDLAEIRVVQLKHQGILQAAVTTSRLVDWWRPACVISFGIAGGFLSGGDVNFEDVVVAEQIFYYEPAKEAPAISAKNASTRKVNPKTRRREKQVRLNRLLPLSADPGLVAKCRAAWGGRGMGLAWKVLFGPIASGEKLVADIESATRKAILSLNDKMLAVEMEAAGVAFGVDDPSLEEFPRRFLAIKGISDNASKGKASQKRHRKPAAANAATFCRMAIESLPIEDDLQRLRKLDINGVRRRAGEISDFISTLLDPDSLVSEEQLSALLASTSPTPIFYHWSIKDERMHWVDFRFLLVLLHLKPMGLSPRILISDHDAPASPTCRSQTEAIVRAVLGPDTPIYWYRDAKKAQEKYFRYADWCGLSRDVLTKELGETEEILLKAFWVSFIGWEVRWTNRCFLLQWRRQADAVRRMSKMIVLRSLVIPTSDLMFGGGLAKKEKPGSMLFVEPPHYPTVLDWLESSPSAVLIEELLAGLSIGGDNTDQSMGDLGALIQGRPALANLIQKSDNGKEPGTRLLQKLAQWNASFFAETV